MNDTERHARLKGEPTMKDRRTLARVPALVAALAVALLLLIGTYAVIASQVPSAKLDLDPPVAASDATTWSSGWITITAGECQTLTHNVVADDPDDLAVEMWFLDRDGDLGINRRYYGGLEDGGDWYGVYWQKLMTNTIGVCRGQQDDVADQIRIRVWVPPDNPDADSGWLDIAQNQTITFHHNLNITDTDLTVGLWFSGTEKGIHNYGYGGLADDIAEEMHGAHWHHLTNNTIRVTRHVSDSNIEQVRVLVVHGASPDYDSLEDPSGGGWQNIARGTTFTFTHNLKWNPNMLLARGECYSSTVGIHHWFAGGNHDWLNGGQWQGTNLQKLTRNTVQVYRQPDDDVCPQVRVRVWRRSLQVYLPVVLSNYSSP
jgi:hypothetical protein